MFPDGPQSAAAKEVALYCDALKPGFQRLIDTDGLVTNGTLIDIFQLLKSRSDGFRATPGTALLNEVTGNTGCGLDPLIKMCLIHH